MLGRTEDALRGERISSNLLLVFIPFSVLVHFSPTGHLVQGFFAVSEISSSMPLLASAVVFLLSRVSCPSSSQATRSPISLCSGSFLHLRFRPNHSYSSGTSFIFDPLYFFVLSYLWFRLRFRAKMSGFWMCIQPALLILSVSQLLC